MTGPKPPEETPQPGRALVTGDGLTFEGRTLCAGDGAGAVLALETPLSFWGGVDDEGTVIDAHHPQRGASLRSKVVLLPAGRGSSSSSSVLAELIRTGCAPAAIVLAAPDAIIALGALAAAELYDVRRPVVQVDHRALTRMSTATHASVAAT